MSRALIVLAFPSDKAKAHRWIDQAPVNTRLTFQPPKRTLPSNDLMWALLTEIAEQLPWHGAKLSAEDYKDMLTASLRKARVVPGIDPGSFVLLGLHTSQMDKEEMSNLIDLIKAFGHQHGVIFGSDHGSQG